MLKSNAPSNFRKKCSNALQPNKFSKSVSYMAPNLTKTCPSPNSIVTLPKKKIISQSSQRTRSQCLKYKRESLEMQTPPKALHGVSDVSRSAVVRVESSYGSDFSKAQIDSTDESSTRADSSQIIGSERCENLERVDILISSLPSSPPPSSTIVFLPQDETPLKLDDTSIDGGRNWFCSICRKEHRSKHNNALAPFRRQCGWQTNPIPKVKINS